MGEKAAEVQHHYSHEFTRGTVADLSVWADVRAGLYVPAKTLVLRRRSFQQPSRRKEMKKHLTRKNFWSVATGILFGAYILALFELGILGTIH